MHKSRKCALMLLTLASFFLQILVCMTDDGSYRNRFVAGKKSRLTHISVDIATSTHAGETLPLDNRTDYTIKLSFKNFFKFVACIFSKNVI
jgi:hypothetical protein